MKASQMFTFIHGHTRTLLCAVKAQKQMFEISDKSQVRGSSLGTGKHMENEMYQTLTYAMLLGLSGNTFYFINHCL